MSEIAMTIYQQLGGKAKAMIGAYDICSNHGGNALEFKFKMSKVANHVSILLTPKDLYNITFKKIRGTSVKTVGVFEDIYAEDLKHIFESTTGLYLTL